LKYIDRSLQRWRTNVALGVMSNSAHKAFDIGCGYGYLLRMVLARGLQCADGCDPRLYEVEKINSSNVLQGFFPAVIIKSEQKNL